jgi:hypothetical protein
MMEVQEVLSNDDFHVLAQIADQKMPQLQKESGSPKGTKRGVMVAALFFGRTKVQFSEEDKAKLVDVANMSPASLAQALYSFLPGHLSQIRRNYSRGWLVAKFYDVNLGWKQEHGHWLSSSVRI